MSVTVTTYNPDGTATAGKSRIIVAPAVADINAPTVAEVNAGVAVQCALEEFGVSISVGTTSRKKLCHTVATKQRGNVEYDDMELNLTLEDPQGDDQAALDALTEGSIVFLVHRPGADHSTDIAAGEKVQVTRAEVATRTLAPVNTEEGNEYATTVTLMVRDTTDLLVPVVA